MNTIIVNHREIIGIFLLKAKQINGNFLFGPNANCYRSIEFLTGVKFSSWAINELLINILISPFKIKIAMILKYVTPHLKSLLAYHCFSLLFNFQPYCKELKYKTKCSKLFLMPSRQVDYESPLNEWVLPPNIWLCKENSAISNIFV